RLGVPRPGDDDLPAAPVLPQLAPGLRDVLGPAGHRAHRRADRQQGGDPGREGAAGMRRFLKIQAPALLFRAVVVLIYAFMFLPIAIVVLVSLNAEPYLTLPPESFSLRWYRQVFTPTWLPPLRYSLVIAAAAA